MAEGCGCFRFCFLIFLVRAVELFMVLNFSGAGLTLVTAVSSNKPSHVLFFNSSCGKVGDPNVEHEGPEATDFEG